MALPVWVWPFAKKTGVWLVSNGPHLVDFAKKYGPPTYLAYKKHGLKPVKIVASVKAELSNGTRSASSAKKAGKPASKAKRRLR